jgi:hypothetical protein
MHERFAAGDTDDGGAAFVGGFETFLGSELAFEDMGGVLDFTAAGAGEVAAEERLEHEHQRIPLPPAHALLDDVAGNRKHLRYRHWHNADHSKNARSK